MSSMLSYDLSSVILELWYKKQLIYKNSKSSDGQHFLSDASKWSDVLVMNIN